MAYGSGFSNNLPPWKPMATMTPPPPAASTAAPGPISNYNAGQLRALQHTQPGGPMPPAAAARPPSMQAPINSSIGQPTPRSAGLGGSVSPRIDSLSRFDNFLRPNTAFTPQATVNTPGLVEGMANTPRSMGPLSSGSVPPSAYSSYLANGGVLPPEPPKPTVDLSGMRGKPGSTVGYSMGGGQPPRSPGAPFSVPPSSGGGGSALPPDTPAALAGAAGALNGAGKFLTGGSFAGAAARAPLLYAAGSAAKQAYDAASDVYNDRPNATLQASLPYRRATYQNIDAGNYGAAAVNAARAMGATGYEVGRNMMSPFSNFLGQAYNEMKGSANAAPATPTGSPPPAVAPPVAPEPATPGVPRVVQPPPQNQSLSERYPDRFKGMNTFRDVVAGGKPMSPQDQAYNAEVLRGMQLENRARELANVSRYRAEQLHDNRSLATLQATHGGPGDVPRDFEREPQDDSSGKLKGMREGINMLDERRNALHQTLFDQNEPNVSNRLNNFRRSYDAYSAVAQAMGLAVPTPDEWLQTNFHMTYDPKTGTYKPSK